MATSHATHLLATGDGQAQALTSGFSRALAASSFVLVAAAIAGLRTTNAHGEPEPAGAQHEAPAPALAGSPMK